MTYLLALLLFIISIDFKLLIAHTHSPLYFELLFAFSDVPEITWVTPSPHVAVKDISDILEVKIDNEKTLITVEWYHNGTQIERKTEGFTFPGKGPHANHDSLGN